MVTVKHDIIIEPYFTYTAFGLVGLVGLVGSLTK